MKLLILQGFNSQRLNHVSLVLYLSFWDLHFCELSIFVEVFNGDQTGVGFKDFSYSPSFCLSHEKVIVRSFLIVAIVPFNQIVNSLFPDDFVGC